MNVIGLSFVHYLCLVSNILDTIPAMGVAVEGVTDQLGVDDVSRLADVLATSQVHAAETPLAQLLLNHLSVPTRSRRPPCPPVDLREFGPLTLEEDEQNFQQFLSGSRSVFCSCGFLSFFI